MHKHTETISRMFRPHVPKDGTLVEISAQQKAVADAALANHGIPNRSKKNESEPAVSAESSSE